MQRFLTRFALRIKNARKNKSPLRVLRGSACQILRKAHLVYYRYNAALPVALNRSILWWATFFRASMQGG